MTTLIVNASIITSEIDKAPRIVDVLHRAMLGLALEGLVCKVEMTSCDDDEEEEIDYEEVENPDTDQTAG